MSRVKVSVWMDNKVYQQLMELRDDIRKSARYSDGPNANLAEVTLDAIIETACVHRIEESTTGRKITHFYGDPRL